MDSVFEFFQFTHAELVEIAYRWILKRGSCGVAFKELRSYNAEIPDVIGFGSGFSSVIECKTSRSDFLSDKKKPHRAKGMGTFRYYCCPIGLIKPEELPEKWGLLYVQPDKNCHLEKNPKKELVKGYVYDPGKDYYTSYYANAFLRDLDAENKLMYSVIRRLFIKGFVKHIYDKDYTQPTDGDYLIDLNEQNPSPPK